MYVTKSIRSISLIALIVCFFGVAAPAHTFAKTKKVPTTVVPTLIAPYTEAAIVTSLNTTRSMQKLQPLTIDPALSSAARTKAKDMIRLGYFDHTTPTGENFGDFMIVAGYDYLAAGENLAAFYTTQKGLTEGWLRSPLHRANILSSTYTDTGIGMAYGTYNGQTGWIVTQLFGTD